MYLFELWQMRRGAHVRIDAPESDDNMELTGSHKQYVREGTKRVHAKRKPDNLDIVDDTIY